MGHDVGFLTNYAENLLALLIFKILVSSGQYHKQEYCPMFECLWVICSFPSVFFSPRNVCWKRRQHIRIRDLFPCDVLFWPGILLSKTINSYQAKWRSTSKLLGFVPQLLYLLYQVHQQVFRSCCFLSSKEGFTNLHKYASLWTTWEFRSLFLY